MAFGRRDGERCGFAAQWTSPRGPTDGDGRRIRWWAGATVATFLTTTLIRTVQEIQLPLPKLDIVVVSTRPQRAGPSIAAWFVERARVGG
ncbi:MAG: hypothetical protein ACYCWW_03900 [Deltaproteobacteria bacterium]